MGIALDVRRQLARGYTQDKHRGIVRYFGVPKSKYKRSCRLYCFYGFDGRGDFFFFEEFTLVHSARFTRYVSPVSCR